jgi:hypothetical protein
MVEDGITPQTENLSAIEVQYRKYIVENGKLQIKCGIKFHNGTIVPDLDAHVYEITGFICGDHEGIEPTFDTVQEFSDHVVDEHLPHKIK